MTISAFDPAKGMPRSSVPAWLQAHYGIPATSESLANAASRGDGPVYSLRGGRAYYLESDLHAWARARISPRGRKASAIRAARDAIAKAMTDGSEVAA